MKLAVFGASGGIGTQLVRQALAAGHQVNAVVRDRSRLAVPDQDGLDVTVAPLTGADALAGAVGGADVVLSALGPSNRGKATMCQDGARAEIAAMRATGVRRLVVVSAAGLHILPGDGFVAARLLKPVVKLLLRNHFADLKVMEELVSESSLDWTMVCPPRLADGPHTGKARHKVADTPAGASTISRADVADFLLRAARDDQFIGTRVFLAG